MKDAVASMFREFGDVAIFVKSPKAYDIGQTAEECNFLLCLYAELFLLKGARHTRVRFVSKVPGGSRELAFGDHRDRVIATLKSLLNLQWPDYRLPTAIEGVPFDG